jgi:hypothetical protein
MSQHHLTLQRKQKDEKKSFQKTVKKHLTWEFALPKFKGSHLAAKHDIFEYTDVFYAFQAIFSNLSETPGNFSRASGNLRSGA